ncbi:MAG: hypothetical protein Q7T66_04830 [Herminiimonas sp.]|uniref:hypothetical protein n=1 Tax=Herminiimonas sp. TaxID=1926289 RepID=UPI00271E7A2B|nr:hypothetical protein [Herminiimonas sp.]MDO9419970.1 hypothetical protein [Herminiimonas sp.]
MGSVNINDDDFYTNSFFTFNPALQPNELFVQEFTTDQPIKPTFFLRGAAMPKNSPNIQYFDYMEYKRAVEAIEREEKLLSKLKS